MIIKTSKFSTFSVPLISPEDNFRKIFDDVPFLKLSSGNYTNGEIVSTSELRIFFDLIKMHNGLLEGSNFYDLGSGVGKPCIAAALLHNFKLCTGIEITKDLYEISLAVLEKATFGCCRGTSSSISFIHASFLEQKSWSFDGDVIFMNSTCFDRELMESVSNCAKNMKPGSFFISLTFPLNPSCGFEVIEELRLTMNWGDADWLLHRKKSLIFLDVDGVLVSKRCLLGDYDEDDHTLFLPSIHSGVVTPIEKQCIKNLKKIIDTCHSKICISSTWREDEKMTSFLMEALRDGGIDTSVVVIGSTESMGSIRGGRGAEITEFLKNNPTEDFIILDDEHADSFASFALTHRYIKTSIEEGLSVLNAEEASRFLRGKV
jgi:SAM-dependent methyltransferase